MDIRFRGIEWRDAHMLLLVALITCCKALPPHCDLSVDKSLAHMTIHPPFQTGQQVTFEFTVTNHGTATCFGPTFVTETFYPGATYVSGGGSGWTCNLTNAGPPGTVDCSYPTLIGSGQTTNFFMTFTVTGPPPDSISDCAEVTNPNDPNDVNDKDCHKEQVIVPCTDVVQDLSTGLTPWVVSRPATPATFAPATLMPQADILGAGLPWCFAAEWIQPANTSTPTPEPGATFTYRRVFTLPAPLSQFATITISGHYNADNRVDDFVLNGNSMGISCFPNCLICPQQFFSITSMNYFAPNNNQLDVKVWNYLTAGDPTVTGLALHAVLEARCK